eukprot:4587021-Heterocapsa_arctica.AAC.1
MGSTRESLRSADSYTNKNNKNNNTFNYIFLDNMKVDKHKHEHKTHDNPNYIARRSKTDMERGTNITALNVSGSLQDFEWILESTDDQIVLIQEHWRLPSEIDAWKSAAFRKGWTG